MMIRRRQLFANGQQLWSGCSSLPGGGKGREGHCLIHSSLQQGRTSLLCDPTWTCSHGEGSPPFQASPLQSSFCDPNRSCFSTLAVVFPRARGTMDRMPAGVSIHHSASQGGESPECGWVVKTHMYGIMPTMSATGWICEAGSGWQDPRDGDGGVLLCSSWFKCNMGHWAAQGILGFLSSVCFSWESAKHHNILY